MTREHRDAVAMAALGKTLIRVWDTANVNRRFECETENCAFNHDGECRFYAVEGRWPVVTEEDGCLSGIIEDSLF